MFSAKIFLAGYKVLLPATKYQGLRGSYLYMKSLIPGIVLSFILALLPSCRKYKDPKGERDPRLDSTFYCNDPDAVNYNWGFPGTPDSTLCYYPADLYAGTYLFTDSVYNPDNSFDVDRSRTTYTLRFYRLSKNRFAVVGFCNGSDTVYFTAERVSLQANVDTLVAQLGQRLCRPLDTVYGNFTRNVTDTTGDIVVNLTVRSDTSTNFHRGKALKQR